VPQIQRPDLAEDLRRKFDIVGPSGIDTIAPELVGVIVVDDMRVDKQTFPSAFSINVTGDAGDIAEVSLQNRERNKLLIPDLIIMSSTAGNRFRVRTLDVGGTPSAGGNTTQIDLRNGIVAPALFFTASDLNTAAGAGTILAQAQGLANTAVVFKDLGIVLDTFGSLEGAVARDIIHFDVNTVATLLLVSVFFHYEDAPLRNV